jgi:hypothetical protein
MKVEAIDGLRVAKVWLSKPAKKRADDAEDGNGAERR